MEETLQQSAPVVTETTAAPATVAETAPVQETAPTADATPWHMKLADEFKTAKPLQNFKDENDLAKSYLHLNKLLGDKVENWAAEDISKLYTKLGRPEDQSKYILPDDLGDGKETIAALGFKLGLTQDQMNELSNELVMKERESAKIAAEARQKLAYEQVESLKAEFGAAFEARINIAKKAVESFGSPELKNLLNETGLGNHPEVVKMFAKIGKEFLEEGRVVKGDHSTVFGVTPAEAKNQINRKMMDKDFMSAYMSATHPAHASAVEEMSKLHALAATKQ